MAVPKASQYQWTDLAIDILRREWAKGTPASRIALILGAASRNVVIGEAHRLKLSKRPSPILARDLYDDVLKGGKKRRQPRGNPPFDWTEAKDAVLRAGYAVATARAVGEIAAELGCSEATVLRRAQELGLKHPRRFHTTFTQGGGTQGGGTQGGAGDTHAGIEAEAAALRAQLMANAPGAAPDSRHLPLADLAPGYCRFPTSPHQVRHGGHRFCGAEIEIKSSLLNYCAFHQRLAVRPVAQYSRAEKCARLVKDAA